MESIGLLWLERGHWGLTTAIYLFFATLGGGAYLAGLAADGVGSDDERGVRLEFARWAFLVAVVAVGIAGIAILSHLADPLAGLLFPLTLQNFDSWITRGTWILVSLGVFTALHVLWFHFGTLGREQAGASTVVRRLTSFVGLASVFDDLADRTRPTEGRRWAVSYLGLVPALGTIYTGFELAAVNSVPLWNNEVVLPSLFLVSGLAAGIATALALTVIFEGARSRTVIGFAATVSALFALSGALLWGLTTSLTATPASTESMAMLSSGTLSVPFTITVVGIAVGIVAIPAFAYLGNSMADGSLTRWVVRPGLVTSLALVVVASFLLRYAVLFAAVKEPIVVVGL